ncbi:MAG: alpha/beta fold hydrolase [Acidobacteria bacterium]|nr:alpha/beta fold hydrolase [Acidobacteriota bacterium]
MYYMVSNRVLSKGTLTSEIGENSYWISDGAGPLDQLTSWKAETADGFRKALIRVAGKFPQILDPEEHEQQRHIGVFVHGFNNSWDDAARRYKGIADDLYAANGLGICVLFTWPSDGSALGYIPDRLDARRSADALADVLSDLYDWAVQKQLDGSKDPTKGCRVKISLIAHSMGAYVTQRAMQTVWTRKNKPLLVSLINQMLLVAADVDNDLFSSGEAVDNSDGDAVANLCYRVTALYTGRDSTLGLSAGFKHFGKRRLGRSGLAGGEPDNVWDVDCSGLIAPSVGKVHSAYFEPTQSKCGELMRQVLRGDDRTLIATWLKGNV